MKYCENCQAKVISPNQVRYDSHYLSQNHKLERIWAGLGARKSWEVVFRAKFVGELRNEVSPINIAPGVAHRSCQQCLVSGHHNCAPSVIEMFTHFREERQENRHGQCTGSQQHPQSQSTKLVWARTVSS